MNIETVNLLRISIMVMGTYIILLMAIIVAVYLRKFATPADRNRRVLIGHIILIGASYAILTGAVMCEMILRYGEPMTWRTPTCAIGLVFGVMAMNLMLWRLAFIREIHPK